MEEERDWGASSNVESGKLSQCLQPQHLDIGVPHGCEIPDLLFFVLSFFWGSHLVVCGVVLVGVPGGHVVGGMQFVGSSCALEFVVSQVTSHRRSFLSTLHPENSQRASPNA